MRIDNVSIAYCGVCLLGLVGLQREEDQLALVHLETLNILLQGLHGPVGAVVVHSNTNGTGILGVQSSTLQMYTHAHRRAKFSNAETA